jgi:hypothetical protein
MFMVSIESSADPTPYGAVRLLLKFRFRVEILIIVSLCSELTL